MMHSCWAWNWPPADRFMHVLVASPNRSGCRIFSDLGLFLSVVIDRDWRIYLDRKVVHFAYFYVLWVTIQFGYQARPSRRIWLSPCRYLYLESSSSRLAPMVHLFCCRYSLSSQN